ncbi:helix-turn-helix transcriptional regulator [Lysinibacillus sp. UGB7]|uniref:helix-turn-helix transcriptional regulator n=1 Tax=Lysinibacillus sp. UGB7 TaxID=3411039 RepID=UPI003B7BD49A
MSIYELDNIIIGEKLDSVDTLKERGYVLVEDHKEDRVEHRIEELLEEYQLTGADIAALIGQTRQSINRAMLGTTIPSVEFALRLAFVLGKSVEDIFSLGGESLWVEKIIGSSNSYIYLQTKDLVILNKELRDEALAKNNAEYWNVQTNELLSREEYINRQKSYIQSQKAALMEELKATNPHLSNNERLSIAAKQLREEFDTDYELLYKQVGRLYDPKQMLQLRLDKKKRK